MARLPVFYRRYMDDVIVLAATRHKLRAAIRTVNAALAGTGLTKAREKTFIGRADRGFDFLGFRVERDGLRVAAATQERFNARVTRLYEQGRGRPEGEARLGDYVRRWRAWSVAGLTAAAQSGAMPSPARSSRRSDSAAAASRQVRRVPARPARPSRVPGPVWAR